jgi:hypothetical protein
VDEHAAVSAGFWKAVFHHEAMIGELLYLQGRPFSNSSRDPFLAGAQNIENSACASLTTGVILVRITTAG